MVGGPRNFFGETRHELIELMRAGPCTVNDLAAAVKLTDNAVRSHLADLMREGVVIHAGKRPGTRKPHALYGLAAHGQELLSQFYAPVLASLIEELKESLSPGQTVELLRETGRRLASPHVAEARRLSLRRRVEQAAEILEAVGGSVEVEKNRSHWTLRGKGCPLASVVSRHPNACELVEALLGEIVGRPVHEHCTRGHMPHCCFEVE